MVKVVNGLKGVKLHLMFTLLLARGWWLVTRGWWLVAKASFTLTSPFLVLLTSAPLSEREQSSSRLGLGW